LKAPALATAIAKLSLTKKAANVVIMDLRKLTTMTDFFVICSADSETQIKAIADAVIEGTEEKGVLPWHKESGSPNWVLLDYSDVVLHIFHRHARSYYNLEKLWGDAKMKYVGDEKPKPLARMRKTLGAKKKEPRRIPVRKVA
jgi:ribosome-associated protein